MTNSMVEKLIVEIEDRLYGDLYHQLPVNVATGDIERLIAELRKAHRENAEASKNFWELAGRYAKSEAALEATPSPAGQGEAMTDAREWEVPLFGEQDVRQRFDEHNVLVRTYRRAIAKKTWRCFHCDQIFTDEILAREHFGSAEYFQANCLKTPLEYMEYGMRRYREGKEAALRASAQPTPPAGKVLTKQQKCPHPRRDPFGRCQACGDVAQGKT